MAKDYYETLGVPKTATQDEIKKAFRSLAHQHHPDKGNGDDKRFKEISEAYQTLGNEQKRKQYDQFGQSFGQAGGFPGGGFNYQDFARRQSGSSFGQGGFSQGGVNFDFGDLGDIFGSFFGGSTRQARRETRGSDIETEIAINFEEAVFGAEKIIDLSKKVVCDRCGGTSAEPGAKISDCQNCQGTGRVRRVQQTVLGAFQTETICPECRGEGKTYEKKCQECRGSGSVHGSEKIKIIIPAGIENGQSIRISGKGEPPSKGKGAPGDLYIHLRVSPSNKFKRQGNDIFSEHHIFVRQAILGDKIDIETVDGPVKLKIPEGTQSRTQFRLRDKGVPRLHGRGRGDHLVEVVVDIPRSLSKKQKKLMEEMEI
ncbi:MAG: molecular chaperone DnaJ [Patescibacteria group bacterium]